jgi:hypothetical protein
VENSYECWLVDPYGWASFTLYLPAFFYAISAFFLLGFTWRKVYWDSGVHSQVTYLISRMLFFVVLYCVIWIVPIIDRTWSVYLSTVTISLLHYSHSGNISIIRFLRRGTACMYVRMYICMVRVGMYILLRFLRAFKTCLFTKRNTEIMIITKIIIGRF